MSKIRLALLSLYLCLSIALRADHIIGGHLSYNCYQVNVTFLKLSLMIEDGVSQPLEQSALIQVYYKQTLADDYQELELFGLGLDETINTSVFLEDRSYTQGIYAKTYFFSNGVGHYKFVYQRCCRSEEMVNIEMSGDEGVSIEMEMYFDGSNQDCMPLGETKPDANPYIEACAESDQLQFEIPTNTIFGDSVSFSFCPLRAGGTSSIIPNPDDPCDTPLPQGFCPSSPVQFKDGFSALQAFGTNANITLDPVTGIISGDMPNAGRYHFGICVDEFLDGVKTKSTNYDMQLRVRTCDNICAGDVLLTTQIEVDSLASFSCFPIQGNLTIVGAGITDLSPLIALDSIYGDLNISSTTATDLEGFNNLVYIGGSLILEDNSFNNMEAFAKLSKSPKNILISGNRSLTSLQPLAQINRIEGDLQIIANRELTSLAGLENIDSIFGNFQVERNPALTESPVWGQLKYVGGDFKLETNNFSKIDFFPELVLVEGQFRIRDNALTEIIGFNQLIRVGGTMFLYNYNTATTQFSGFNQLDSVGGSLNVTAKFAKEFEGFQNLTKVGGVLSVNGDEFTSIDGFENLERAGGLYFNKCDKLQTLPSFNKLDSLTGNLTISECPELQTIDGFNQLQQINRNFELAGLDKLTSIKGFGMLVTIGEYFSMNKLPELTELPEFESLQFVGEYLRIRSLEALTELKGFNQLEQIEESFNISKLEQMTSFDAFNKLSYIGTSFGFRDNNSLTAINGFEDLLFVGDDFFLTGNLQLSVCTAFCNFLRNGQLVGSIFMGDNAPGCEAFIEGCAQAIVKGAIFYDANQNGIQEPDERSFPYATQQLQIQPEAIQVVSQGGGNYIFYLDDGNYTLATKPDSPFKTTSSPLSLNVSPTDSCINLDIGLFAETEVTAGETNLVFANGLRCNSIVELKLQVTNTGSVPLNAKVALVLDNLTDFQSAVPSVEEQIGDSILWPIENLFLGDSEVITIKIKSPSEQFTAQSARFTSYLFDESNNEIYTAPHQSVVRCSYDPNDKATAPQREGEENYTLFEEDLRYTIRFENTGNDTAFLVRISDELDSNLDWSTFKFIQASHPLSNYTLTKEGRVIFTFEEINLLATMQDSTQSMGYVQYGISPKTGLAENTVIENKASIYFDSNPPIITNTVINTMVSELPTFVKYIEDELAVQLYPNPFDQELFLKTQRSYSNLNLRVFNLTGQLVFEKELSVFGQEEKIDLPPIGKGLFIFQLVDMESGRRSSFRMFRGE